MWKIEKQGVTRNTRCAGLAPSARWSSWWLESSSFTSSRWRHHGPRCRRQLHSDWSDVLSAVRAAIPPTDARARPADRVPTWRRVRAAVCPLQPGDMVSDSVCWARPVVHGVAARVERAAQAWNDTALRRAIWHRLSAQMSPVLIRRHSQLVVIIVVFVVIERFNVMWTEIIISITTTVSAIQAGPDMNDLTGKSWDAVQKPKIVPQIDMTDRMWLQLFTNTYT